MDPDNVGCKFSKAKRTLTLTLNKTKPVPQKVDKPDYTKFSVRKIRAGKGPLVQKMAWVTVHYTGRLLDGTIFDSSV